MDETQKNKVLEWFRRHGTGTCIFCGKSTEFQVVNDLIAAPVLRDAMVQLGNLAPLVGLLCKNCASIQFFSAVVMGVVEPAKIETEF